MKDSTENPRANFKTAGDGRSGRQLPGAHADDVIQQFFEQLRTKGTRRRVRARIFSWGAGHKGK